MWFHVFVASFHRHARTQCWHGVKESQKRKKTFVADEEKAAMSVNVSCVTRNGQKNQFFGRGLLLTTTTIDVCAVQNI